MGDISFILIVKEWPIERTQKEQDESVSNCSIGYIRQDMCTFIDFTSMAPDDLHLRNKLSLKLLKQVCLLFKVYKLDSSFFLFCG